MVRVYQDTREELYANAWTEQLPTPKDFDPAGTLGESSGPRELGGTGAEGNPGDPTRRTEPLPGQETGDLGASDLDAMTVAELRELADEYGVDLGGATKKAEIVDVLRADGV